MTHTLELKNLGSAFMAGEDGPLRASLAAEGRATAWHVRVRCRGLASIRSHSIPVST